MEASDISKIVYELMRLSDDRNMMFREDERGLLLREIDKLKLLRQNDLRTQRLMSREFAELKQMVDESIRRKSAKRSQETAFEYKKSQSKTKLKDMCMTKKSHNCIKASTPGTDDRGSTCLFDVSAQTVTKTNINNAAELNEPVTENSISVKRQRTSVLNTNDVPATSSNTNGCQDADMREVGESAVPEIKYVATKHDNMRKHDVRAALPGHLCIQCKSYFDTLIEQGMIPSESLMKDMLRKCSRHKAKYSPPSTPDGYWNLTVQTPPEWK